MTTIKRNYEVAREIYRTYGVDTDLVIEKIKMIPLSIHCWQLDDIRGFEGKKYDLSGGIAVTGEYPKINYSLDAYRNDMAKILKLIPGKKKLNLHAIYLDAGNEMVDRDQIKPEHFKSWVTFAKENNIGIDFNPTCFSHPMSQQGQTLSSSDDSIRNFWINHIKQSRKIGEYFGKELDIRCITNIWIPDGSKEVPVDQLGPRKRLEQSLDEIFSDQVNPLYNMDALESKLFGIGTESYVVGSHEFYTNYVAKKGHSMICLDAGHFHPTETISQKITAYLALQDELLIHVSRPVRWDSDHVVLFDDETKAIMHEIVRSDALDRVHLALDFFDGSINRFVATVLGARNALKSLLFAMLEPTRLLKELESTGKTTERLVLIEELKTLPFGFIWDKLCDDYGINPKDFLGEIHTIRK